MDRYFEIVESAGTLVSKYFSFSRELEGFLWGWSKIPNLKEYLGM